MLRRVDVLAPAPAPTRVLAVEGNAAAVDTLAAVHELVPVAAADSGTRCSNEAACLRALLFWFVCFSNSV